MRFVDFYNRDREKPLEDIVRDVATVCYGYNNLADLDRLRLMGFEGEAFLYTNGIGGDNPISETYQEGQADAPPIDGNPAPPDCSAKFKSNNILGVQKCANYGGMPALVWIRNNHPEWFVRHKSTQKIVRSGGKWVGNIYLDINNPEVRAYFVEQLDKLFPGQFDGILIDNLSPEFHAGSGGPVETEQWGPGNGDDFKNIQLSWLDFLRGYVRTRTGHKGKPGKLFVNLNGNGKDTDYWLRCCIQDDGSPRIDGVMIEFAFDDDWLNDLLCLERVTAHGLEAWVLSQSKLTDEKAIQFATICHLMIEGPLTKIKYGEDGDYKRLLIPAIAKATEQLQTPQGRYYRRDGRLFRNFNGGIIWIDEATRECGVMFHPALLPQSPPWLAPMVNRVNAVGDKVVYKTSARAARGGTVHIEVVSGLPPGLEMDSDGVIAGTCTTSGKYLVGLKAYENVIDGQASAYTEFTWTINSPFDTKITPTAHGVQVAVFRNSRQLGMTEFYL